MQVSSKLRQLEKMTTITSMRLAKGTGTNMNI